MNERVHSGLTSARVVWEDCCDFLALLKKKSAEVICQGVAPFDERAYELREILGHEFYQLVALAKPLNEGIHDVLGRCLDVLTFILN